MAQALTVALLYHDQLHIGGVETCLLSLLRLASPAGFRWLLIAPASPSFVAKVQALGAKWVAWQPQRSWDAAACLKMVRLLRSEAVDVVHAHSPAAALIGGIAARIVGRPLVVTVHLPLHEYVLSRRPASAPKRRLYIAIESIIHHLLAREVIYVSARRRAEGLVSGTAPRKRSRVIHNGIELPTGHPAPEARRNPPMICFVGRLVPQKGLDILLAALARLGETEPPWRLSVVGDGPGRAELESQATALGLQGVVEFLGFREPAMPWLLAADIFVLPSRAEGMSIALLEAMAAGCACVVTDVGENAHVVGQAEAGLIVPPADVAGLADAICLLLRHESMRSAMQRAAWLRARDFDHRGMFVQTEAVYQSVA